MTLSGIDAGIVLLPLLGAVVLIVWLRRYVRGVSDFLAARRGAGRYLLCTASGEASAGVVSLVAAMEVFARAGFSLHVYAAFSALLWALLSLSGFVTFRFRETRALTFHQFIEARYSRRLRVCASALQVISGLFFFGLIPGVAARFFVGFLQLPVSFDMFGATVPMATAIMVGLLAFAVFFTLGAGQIGVLVSDSCEYVFSAVLYLVIAVVVLGAVSAPMITWDQAREALSSGGPGHSFLAPFDIGARADFNGSFVLMGMALNVYYFRGNAASAVAAGSAHEARMASILGTWRGIGTGGLVTLIMVVAFTRLKHPDFAAQAELVEQSVASAPTEQLRNQLRMPVSLALSLPPGARGAFAAIALLGTLATMGAYCMMLGTTLLQDVVLPLRGRPLEPRRHLRWLRWAVFGAGAATVLLSTTLRTTDYLTLLMTLFGSIYLGGMGAVVIGGLYWRRGTTLGAWVAMIGGAVLALTGWGLQAFWPQLAPTFAPLAADVLGLEWDGELESFPLNGQVLSLLTALVCITLYIVTSVCSRQKPFPLERLLHRGEGAERRETATGTQRRGLQARLDWWLAIGTSFKRSDRRIAYALFGYSVLWNIVALGCLAWNVAIERWAADAWWRYVLVQNIICALAIAAITTVWFGIGAVRDVRVLLRRLRTAAGDPADDGQFFDVEKEPARGATQRSATEATEIR
jgi:SSS family solute:Na+ symporter